MEPETILVEHIRTPRTWVDIDPEMQSYFIEFECLLVFRQLLELNLKPSTVADIMALNLMKGDKVRMTKFREYLKITNQRYTNREAFTTALCRYLWVAGIGINKIMRLCHTSQTTVYKIAYEMEEAHKSGYFKNHYTQFVSQTFLNSLDNMMNALRTMEGYTARRDRNSKKIPGYDHISAIKRNISKNQMW